MVRIIKDMSTIRNKLCVKSAAAVAVAVDEKSYIPISLKYVLTYDLFQDVVHCTVYSVQCAYLQDNNEV